MTDETPTFIDAQGNKITEREILDNLEQRGIARPIPTYETAGEECANPGCDEPVPENSHKTMNFGLQAGYCSLACRMEGDAL